MKKLIKRVQICFLLAVMVWCGTLFADRQTLREELVRLHVVAASDTREDQDLKLRVRDAVLESLESALAEVGDAEQAKAWLKENLGKLEKVANDVLRAAGCGDTAVVSLIEEAFGTRSYDTFTLPAGVYDALRITIGAGEGENWWCVVYPEFCIGAAAGEIGDIAAGAGFPDSLSGAITGETVYQIRFFFLDVLGKLENLLHGG